jgi:hypothetical protein
LNLLENRNEFLLLALVRRQDRVEPLFHGTRHYRFSCRTRKSDHVLSAVYGDCAIVVQGLPQGLPAASIPIFADNRASVNVP